MSDVQSGEAQVIAKCDLPITQSMIGESLRSAGVSIGDVIIVHSSLSRLGWVVGGPLSVVLSLNDAVGDSGTIVMPAQTGISDPATWINPPVPEHWWPTIRDNWPSFDPATSPLRAMGAVVECFRQQSGVLHSGHPAVGFVARGPRAKELLAGQPLEHSLSEDSPLGALYRADARIVLLGVGHGNNTSLHLAEHRADYHGKKNVQLGAPMTVDGQQQWVTYEDLDRDDEDFAALGRAFVESGGVEQRVNLGIGEVVTCSVQEIVDFAVTWLSTNRS